MAPPPSTVTRREWASAVRSAAGDTKEPGDRPVARLARVLGVMVDSAQGAVDAVLARGGTIVQAIGADAPESTARFCDPAGNVLDIYLEQGTATAQA